MDREQRQRRTAGRKNPGKDRTGGDSSGNLSSGNGRSDNGPAGQTPRPGSAIKRANDDKASGLPPRQAGKGTAGSAARAEGGTRSERVTASSHEQERSGIGRTDKLGVKKPAAAAANAGVRRSGQGSDRSSATPRRTAEWARAFAGFGLLAGLYAAVGGEALLLLLELSGLLMLAGAALQLFGPRGLQAARSLSAGSPEAGAPVTVITELTFSSRLPVPWLLVEDYWDGTCKRTLLFPGLRRSLRFEYELDSPPRGRHRLALARAVWGDLTGWFTGSREVAGELEFLVLPSPLYYGPGRSLPLGLSPGSAASVRGYGAGETVDIRSYRPGDPMNRIHWKSSARRGSLQTRQPEREASRMLCIVLDNASGSYERPWEALGSRSVRQPAGREFELAVSAAMGLLRTAESARAYTQLFSGGWPDHMARYEGMGRIPDRVLGWLAEIAPDGSRSLTALLDDASRQCLPGMSLAVITGRLERESASAIARLLALGVGVEVYYAWDREAPETGTRARDPEAKHRMKEAGTHPGTAASLATRKAAGTGTAGEDGTIGASLRRLGAVLYRLEEGCSGSEREGREPAWSVRGGDR